MKFFIVGGLRPDFINLALLIKRLDEKYGRENVVFCHTGQHYDFFLNQIFFEELGLRNPDYHLGAQNSLTPTEQIAKVISMVEPILAKEKPDIAISFSDGNPSMFGITPNRMGIRLLHLEAGMRSNDARMQEEKNRRIIDSISDYLFAPSIPAYWNLVGEGYAIEKIQLVGKLILDTIKEYMPLIEKAKRLLDCGIDLETNNYFLAEFHRPENVDNPLNLRIIMDTLHKAALYYGVPVIFPMHPRTEEAIKRYGINIDRSKIFTQGPIGFFEFEYLQKHAKAVMTDSGTSQEVCCWHHIPCLVMRMSTERVECLQVGASLLAGDYFGTFDSSYSLDLLHRLIERKNHWKVPYKPDAVGDIVKFFNDHEAEILKRKVWWDD